MTVRCLTTDKLPRLVQIAATAAAARGRDFYAWKNSPEVSAKPTSPWTHATGWGDTAVTREISASEAADIYKSKLGGAYGERLMMTLGYVIGAVRAGVEVAILQINEEATPAFDPEGWLVISINRHPFFHISPGDLPMAELEKEGLVNVVAKDGEDGKLYAWKPEIGSEGKPREFALLLGWLLSPPSSPGAIS